MFGSDLTMTAMGTILALLGAVPAGVALASDRPRESPRVEQSMTGTIGDVRRERPVFVTQEGRELRVDWERCAPRAVTGEVVTLTGRWDGREFEPRQMRLANGETVVCRADRASEQRAAASAAIGAPEAIAAATRAGYRAVTEVEWERGAWQLRAQDAQGAPVRLTVDGSTGAVTRSARR